MTTKKIAGRTYSSLSFSCPPEMEHAINRRTVELGFHSRSDYLRRLFERDLAAAGLYDPKNLGGQAPPRIKRGRKPKKK
jgi:hypothetical protein